MLETVVSLRRARQGKTHCGVRAHHSGVHLREIFHVVQGLLCLEQLHAQIVVLFRDMLHSLTPELFPLLCSEYATIMVQ